MPGSIIINWYQKSSASKVPGPWDFDWVGQPDVCVKPGARTPTRAAARNQDLCMICMGEVGAVCAHHTQRLRQHQGWENQRTTSPDNHRGWLTSSEMDQNWHNNLYIFIRRAPSVLWLSDEYDGTQWSFMTWFVVWESGRMEA